MEIGPLPADVQAALARLASQYPDQITFDAGNRHASLRQRPDLQPRQGCRSRRMEPTSLDSTGNDPRYAISRERFELVIMGHTDDVPAQVFAGTQHPTNMHLSVHRAIAVRDVLVGSGITCGSRVQVAGWGEYRPLIQNETGGTAANRRVEIYLSAMTDTMDHEWRTPRLTTTTTTADRGYVDEPMK